MSNDRFKASAITFEVSPLNIVVAKVDGSNDIVMVPIIITPTMFAEYYRPDGTLTQTGREAIAHAKQTHRLNACGVCDYYCTMLAVRARVAVQEWLASDSKETVNKAKLHFFVAKYDNEHYLHCWIESNGVQKKLATGMQMEKSYFDEHFCSDGMIKRKWAQHLLMQTAPTNDDVRLFEVGEDLMVMRRVLQAVANVIASAGTLFAEAPAQLIAELCNDVIADIPDGRKEGADERQ